MVTVKVPATSANIGSGFDTCGLALNLYNTAAFELADSVVISSADGSFTPQGETNLVYQTAKHVYHLCGKPLPGLKIVQTNAVPMARGLGSSSACIAAGILGANALLGDPLNAEDVLTLATELEGHPDNVAPALLGGFVVSAFDEGKVYALKKTISTKLVFAAFIPSFKLLTEKARAALPQQIAHRDAVYNVSRAALLSAAFCEERYDLLAVAVKDVLHQPYRLPLIAGGRRVFDLAHSLGAPATFISGAGPTILSVLPAENDAFFEQARVALQEDRTLSAFTLHRFAADNTGAAVVQG
ncbi:MAG: homoserine kinase [Ruthenibacterium sp.]